MTCPQTFVPEWTLSPETNANGTPTMIERLRRGRSGLFYGWVIVAAALIMNIAASPTNALSFSFFITPMSEDLGWSRSELALGLTFRLGIAGLTAPLVGMLVDRIGARALGTLAGLLTGFTLIGLAFVNDLWLYYLLFALSGLSGFGGPAGQLLTTVPVAKWFNARRGRALAIASVGVPLGTALYLPIVQSLIATFDWRTAWVITGLFVMALSVPACALLMRKDPESLGLLPDGATAPESVSQPEKDAAAQALKEENWTLGEALRTRAFWIIVAWVGLSGLMIQGGMIYRTTYWEDIGISSGVIALGTALDPLMLVFSGLLFGFLAEKIAIRYLGFIGMVGVACSMIPLVLAWNSPIPLLAQNLIWGSFMGANIMTNNTIWPAYFGRQHIGTIRGFIFPMAVGSAALSPLFFGVLDGVIPSFRYIWLVPLGAFVVSGLLLLYARPPKRTSLPAAPPPPQGSPEVVATKT